MNLKALIRRVSSSTCISFGTTTPYAFGSKVQMTRVGFADLKVVEVHACGPAGSLDDLVPIVRQVVFRTLEANGIPSNCLLLTPSVGVTKRNILFVDTNPSSQSCGLRKRGCQYTFHFEFNGREWFNFGQSLRIPEAT